MRQIGDMNTGLQVGDDWTLVTSINGVCWVVRLLVQGVVPLREGSVAAGY